jgi:hypothetical protein
MKTLMQAIALAATLAAGSALAQEDAGLVNQVSGPATYSADGGPARPVQAFMKVRSGDRFTLAAGATLRLVYFEGNRQESWSGPAVFRAARAGSEASSGKPVVAALPTAVSVKIARLPELVQAARLGGVTVRGATRFPALTTEEQTQVSEARATYKTLRAQAHADDITPELFLLSALQEVGQYDEMTPLLDELSKHTPLSPEVEELVRWVRTRQ